MRWTALTHGREPSRDRRRCVFLDRDGVINEAPPEGTYVQCVEEFHLIPSIVDWIKLFNSLDLLVIVITNQRGIARGLVTLEQLDVLHAHMIDCLADRGAHVDDVLFCPHERGECGCRKPSPGLVLRAQETWNVDLDGSIVIGDSENDRLLAAHCGLTFVQVLQGRIMQIVPGTHCIEVPGDLGGRPDDGASAQRNVGTDLSAFTVPRVHTRPKK